MFLINTKELAPAGAAGGRSQEFAVLGATGNGEKLRAKHLVLSERSNCKHIFSQGFAVLPARHGW